MSKFTYDRGTWKADNPLPDLEANEEFKDYLYRLGFTERAGLFGHEDAGHIEIYESNEGTYFANVTPAGNVVYDVFLPDFGSYMMFIKDYGTLFSTDSANILQQQMLDIMEKLFRLQHGHAAYDFCKQCDPIAWDQFQKRKSARVD